MRQMLRVRVGRDGSPVVIDIVAAEPDQRRFSLRMGRDLRSITTRPFSLVMPKRA